MALHVYCIMKIGFLYWRRDGGDDHRYLWENHGTANSSFEGLPPRWGSVIKLVKGLSHFLKLISERISG